MFVHVLCSLSVEDEFSLVGNPDYVVLHGMAEQPLTLQRNLKTGENIRILKIIMHFKDTPKERAVLR